MSDGSAAFDFGQTVFIFLSALGLAWWIGTIMTAKGGDKLTRACAPVGYTMDGLTSVTTGLVGSTPQWTLSSKQYLMSGCYYFFSVVLKPGEEATGGTITRGGVRTY